MPQRSSDDLDNDHTDELPVLLDTVGLEGDVEPLFAERHEDTSEHPAFSAPAGLAPAGASAEELAELKQRIEQIPGLEAQIRVLTDSIGELERIAADKDRRLEELEAELAEARRQRDDSAAAKRELATELALRDARLAELTATLERVAHEAGAVSAELEQARSAAEAARRDAEALREAVDRPAPGPAPVVADLREEYAALAAYVEGRRSWWEELQTTNARLAARVASLEHDLKAGAKRLAAAEDFAQRESNRAVELRAELVEYARRVDALEREHRLVPADSAAPTSQSAPAKTTATPAPAEPAPNSGGIATIAGSTSGPPETPPVLTDAVDGVASSVEALAQLEAEVEYKRQQVAAQLIELRDREQRLRNATSELGSLRAELDESRANVARLERTLADKDRALETRDARIATLHEELKQRAISAPPGESSAGRAGLHDAPDSSAAPVLICLTGDAPRRFVLAKRTITVGRGPQCDLQILTHFVSREHARITSQGGATVIEDLGSRNGVFVNSVRVDRQSLQQGDLVTIGETQFRFVESMAH